MKIELISKAEHTLLVKLANDYPNLVFQNNGYQYINKSKLTEEELQKIGLITDLLKKHIGGFREFNNFCHNKAGDLKIRLQYNYNHELPGLPFTGVGYIKVDELLNGFGDER